MYLVTQVGDRVFFCNFGGGTFAEKAAVDESRAGLLGPTLSFEQGAAIGVPYLTACWAIKHRLDNVYIAYKPLFCRYWCPFYTHTHTYNRNSNSIRLDSAFLKYSTKLLKYTVECNQTDYVSFTGDRQNQDKRS